METNELSEKAMGGTELMLHRLHSSIDKSLLDNFQIIPSRVRGLDMKKKRIYWVHDLPGDPEVAHLKDGGWKQFHKIVFVSYWQQQMYNAYLGVPYSAGTVIQNAVEPFEAHSKPDDGTIRLLYTSTPHRGLDILYAVFSKIKHEFPELRLEVFSSFELYGWGERDKQFNVLLNSLEKDPHVDYHKSVPNSEIREAIKRSHIFAYPSKWQETSCLCLIEAMAGGLMCVHSSLAALPETSKGLTFMYDYSEDIQQHANRFYVALRNAILLKKSSKSALDIHHSLDVQSKLSNDLYGWDRRKNEWEQLFKELLA